MSFNAVAKKIIKETISSAVFIDDKALENFKSKNYKFADDHNRTINLFNDFKKNNCLLHSFKFTKKGWKDYRNFYLKNKDLLILDWQLIGDDHNYALKILEEAVWEKSLHFICIYTNENLSPVKNELIRYYNGYIEENQVQEIRNILLDTPLYEYWELNDQHESKVEIDTYINNILNARSEDINEEINLFYQRFDISKEKQEQIITLANSTWHSFAKLRTAFFQDRGCFAKKTPEKLFTLSKTSANTLYINHTIIKIFKKDEVGGEQLYDEFLESFLQDQNKFLTLMGLELRNRFRDNSAFIGKDFTDLSEDAFFYHKNKNIEHPFLFTDYLIEILKDQVSSFINEKELELFKAFDEYYQTFGGDNRINAFMHGNNAAQFKIQVFKLNYFYNRLNIYERKKSTFLRFGDVFSSEVTVLRNGEKETKTKYFMCITPHCDCLRPQKINNQFWFVEGMYEQTQASVLTKTDGKFISFLKDDTDEIFAVNWRNGKDFCQPFTIQVLDNNFETILDGLYYGKKIELKLIACIKENYAQRIANEASNYNLRIGIDFVKK